MKRNNPYQFHLPEENRVFPAPDLQVEKRTYAGLHAAIRGSRQCLSANILPDVRHLAISNGNGEHPIIYESVIRRFDPQRSGANGQNPVCVRYELGEIGYDVSTASLAF